MGRYLSARRQLGAQDKHLLFDTSPGAKTFVVPSEISGVVPARLRIAVIGGGGCGWNNGGFSASGGAGGGYSEYYKTVNPGDSFGYIVGVGGFPTHALRAAGTSSFNGEISATGGASGSGYGASGGMGCGGVINSRGGSVVVTGTAQVSGGACAGSRNGAGANVIVDTYGGLNARFLDGTGFLLDGFGLGMLPNSDNQYGIGGLGGLTRYENGKTVFYGEDGGIGAGAGSGGNLTIDTATQSMFGGRAGIGGGGAMSLWGSGHYDGTPGGNGAVIIEIIDWR